jgi:hypothetical protein
MNWKQTLIIGGVGSLLSSLASIIYMNIYSGAMIVNFSAVAGVSSIIASCVIGCFLMVIGYKLAIKWKGIKTIGWLNILYSLFSFATIAGVFGVNLPLETESPELFPGLVVPMHFFPVLSIVSVLPFFKIVDSHLPKS